MEGCSAGLGLALGGGGMKGLAHVGAISVIEKAGLKPGMVSGSSIGSVIGALYAAGLTADEIKLAAAKQPLLSLLSLRFDGKGMLDASGLRAFLDEHIGDVTFDDLKLAFCVTSTDLESGELVLIESGSVIDAVLASSAIPGLFAPVVLQGKVLMDGGMLENLPIEPLRSRGARWVIGIRLFHQRRNWKLAESRRKSRPDSRVRKKWRERMSLEDLRHLPASVMERWLQAGHADFEAFRVAQRGLDLMMSRQEEDRLALNPPDVLISPDVVDIGPLDFHEDTRNVYRAGVKAAMDEIEKLRALQVTVAEMQSAS